MKNTDNLIIGANGTVGQELARLLKLSGRTVRAATSKRPTSKDQVQLNLVTGVGLKDAFDNVERAFFLSPPGYADQHAILSPLIQEAKRRGLKKIVLMTAMGANANESSPFRRAEIELEKSGLAYNIIRPNWFLQNFNTYWLHGILTQNQIRLPAGNAKVSFIDARDIAATAQVLLTSDDFNNQTFDLTGPESVDHAQVAKTISRVTGQNITYHEITEDEFLKSLIGAGLPKDYAHVLVTIMGFLRQGFSEQRTPFVKEITGQEPRNLENYVNDYKTAFTK